MTTRPLPVSRNSQSVFFLVGLPISVKARMTEKQIEEFEALAKPLVEWINANKNPHTKIVVDCMGAEVVDGCYGFHTDEYVKD